MANGVRFEHARTGVHFYQFKSVGDRRVAVWTEHDGPDFRGYFKSYEGDNGQKQEATRQEYEAYKAT